MSTFRNHALRAGATISDGQVQDGWAVHPMVGRGAGRAHHWTRGNTHDIDGKPVTGVRTACGLQSVVYGWASLLGAGNYEFCARCERALMKRMKR